jgi:hypothetical protein
MARIRVRVLQGSGMKCGGKENSLFELRAILRISGPLAAAYLAEIAMGITDMLFVVLRSFVAA